MAMTDAVRFIVWEVGTDAGRSIVQPGPEWTLQRPTLNRRGGRIDGLQGIVMHFGRFSDQIIKLHTRYRDFITPNGTTCLQKIMKNKRLPP